MVKFFKKNKELIISPFIVLAVLLLIYAVKGNYPFGRETIGYYDMEVSFVPLYTHIHDVMHGRADLFFDWLSGCGEGAVTGLTYFGLNPFNFLFLFIGRDSVANAMSYMLILKMMAISIAMSIYVKKRYPEIGTFYNIIVSLLYTFSGYVIQYYTNIYFLDMVVLFPLVMLGLDNMLTKNKCMGYLLAISAAFILNINLSYMVCLFIIIYTMAYVIFGSEKGTAKRSIANVGIYTVIALLISTAVVWPVVIKTLMSSRIEMAQESSYFDIISADFCKFWGNKMMMFYGCELGIVSIIFMLIAFLKEKREKKLFFNHLFKLIFLVLPFMYEGINLMWHTGSYIHFPARFGFILVFECMEIFCCFLTKYKSGCIAEPKKTILRRLPYIVAVPLIVVYTVILAWFAHHFVYQGIHNNEGYLFWLLPTLFMGCLTYMLIVGFTKGKAKRVFVGIMAAIQIIIAGWGFIAPIDYEESLSNQSYLITKLTRIRNSLNIKNDNISRFKNTDGLLFNNYNLIFGYPSMSEWLNDASAKYVQGMINMGYTGTDRAVFDSDGTMLTDALLNVKYLISVDERNEELYSFKQSVEDINIYENKYSLPFGMQLPDRAMLDIEFDKEKLSVNQNKIYEALAPGDGIIFEDYNLKKYVTKVKETENDNDSTSIGFRSSYGESFVTNSSFQTTLKIPVEGEKTLYIRKIITQDDEENAEDETDIAQSDDSIKSGGYVFFVNGERKNIVSFKTEAYAGYPNSRHTGFVELGTYKDETITLDVIGDSEDISNLEICLMDNKLMGELIDYYSDKCAYDIKAEGASLSMMEKAEQECYVFIPVQYDKNWSAKVNGEKAEVEPALDGMFMAVKIPAGESKIEMKYFPSEIPLGSIISFIGIVLAALCLRLNYCGLSVADNKYIKNVCFVVFILIFAAFVIFFNILPIIFGIISKLEYVVWLVNTI